MPVIGCHVGMWVSSLLLIPSTLHPSHGPDRRKQRETEIGTESYALKAEGQKRYLYPFSLRLPRHLPYRPLSPRRPVELRRYGHGFSTPRPRLPPPAARPAATIRAHIGPCHPCCRRPSPKTDTIPIIIIIYHFDRAFIDNLGRRRRLQLNISQRRQRKPAPLPRAQDLLRPVRGNIHAVHHILCDPLGAAGTPRAKGRCRRAGAGLAGGDSGDCGGEGGGGGESGGESGGSRRESAREGIGR
ncbi:hypothetical protein BZA05DRAFT_267521 [Tricharina praecox]|uniref:uncharacterized protein n=1 Tax=Tricharina praecox TaxID=43433 RepID=UPI00221EE8D4|nr:uncharacterized protein BZA05DRAFT_267521 [Tricharina praecox]KAI5853708.1 hypothetical protein BZA05DRAFT_267521 [Tricharina praecox]